MVNWFQTTFEYQRDQVEFPNSNLTSYDIRDGIMVSWSSNSERKRKETAKFKLFLNIIYDKDDAKDHSF